MRRAQLGGRGERWAVLLAGLACLRCQGSSPSPPSVPANAPAVPIVPDKPGLLDVIEPLADSVLVGRAQASAALERSRVRWQTFLAEHPDGYAYLRSYSAAPDRIQNTTVLVRGARVLEHRCAEWGGPNQAGDGRTRPVAEVDRCHPPLSIDVLYDRCAQIIDQAESTVVLKLHQNGILAACALPGARCDPSSMACVTVRWVWKPGGEQPCLIARGAFPHASKHQVACNWCTCENGLEGCTDAGPDMCLP